MVESYKNYLIDLWSGSEHRTTKLWRNVLYSFITIFTVNVSTYLLSLLFGVREEYIHQRASLNYSITWFYVILVVFIFPILEELTFRLFLSLKRKHILISFSLMYAFFVTAGILFLFKKEIENVFFVFVVVGLFLFLKSLVMLSVPILGHPPMSKLLTNFSRSHFKVIYFGSAVLFGLLHLIFQSLYSDTFYIIILLFFISYFVSGLVFNSGRMAIGFLYVVLLHMAINLMAFL